MSRMSFYVANVRPYHVALAHRIAHTRGAEQERMAELNARFQRLPHWLQTLCRIEVAEVRAAKRGERLAVVA